MDRPSPRREHPPGVNENMARWLILSVVVVALAVIATILANITPAAKPDGAFRVSSRQGPAPKARLEGGPTYNFGTMSQKTTGTHAWTVHNEGEADLELWMQSSTCMCTIAKFKDKQRAIVKPGESTTVELEWETRETLGEFSKGATIGTNDPGQPSFPLYIKGTVYPPVVTIPNDGMIDLEKLSSEDPATVEAAVFAPDMPELKILKITTSRPDFITVDPSPLNENELKRLKLSGGYKLKIDLKRGLPIGPIREEIAIQTNHRLAPELKLNLFGTVAGPIVVLPEKLMITNLDGGVGGSGEVTLLVRGGRPTKFEVIQKPEKLNVDVEPNETPTLKGRYRVNVTVPPGTASGQIQGLIVIKTDNPKAAELKIPVNILVLGGNAG